MITQQELKEILHYDPDTGLFTRLHRGQNGALKGDVAGSRTATGAIIIQIGNNRYPAHRLAWLYMKGELPNYNIIHIKKDKSNNKWSNLSMKLGKGCSLERNTSGCIGVSYETRNELWVAKIMRDGVRKYLGSFKGLDDAIAARKEAEEEPVSFL